jgi:hypothetical protein
MKKIITLGLFLAFAKSFSQNTPQRTCGTQIPPQQFEVWVNSLQNQQTPGPKNGSNNVQSVFNVPVIVHIIHNNEAVNSVNATSGNNLNAAQVIDQINILNKDYNSLNADTISIPTVFKPAQGKMRINFCLAVVNPTGGVLAEPGIDRINRVAKGWSASPYSQTYIDATIKPNSIWDPNRYLNIWVCALGNSLLGYATFPNPGASGLSGLSSPYGSTTTDGVVILNTSFGSVGTAVSGAYNLGRTTTHEVGHWAGLRHIWGDGTCATDYCNDTPPAQTSNFGCPSFPYKLGTCTGNTTGEMTMNYMDYTDDACMYLFTKDQAYRSQLIMTYSTMRAALATSTACNLPSISTDAGISSVAGPTYSQVINCNNFINPILNVTNYGTTTLTSITFSYNVDAINTQTMLWTGSANPNTTFTVVVPQISNLSNGAHNFNVTLSAPNGTVDANVNNNTNNQYFVIANQLSITVNSPTACAGAAVTLTASGGTTYSWTNVGNTASVSVSPTATTVYTLTASNGNCSVVRTTTVNVVAGPLMTANNATACGGATVNLNASGATTFTWNTGANSSGIVASSFSTTTYTVIGSNGSVCNATRIVTLSILPTPLVVVNNATICPGVTTTLNVNGANTYSWSTGNTSNAIIVSPATSTVYQVVGTIGTCTDTKTVSVTIGTSLSMLLSPAQPSMCAGSSLSLTASGANNYTWSSGGNSNSVVLNPAVTTVYTITGTSSNCPGTKIFTLTVNQLPVTTITATNIACFGGSNGQIFASASGNGPFTYAYTSGSVNLGLGVYSVITTDAKGCVSTTTINISQPAAINVSANGGITSCPSACDGSAQIVPTGGTAPFTATLFPGNASGLNFTSLCAGNYNAFVVDANGCATTSTFVVSQGNVGVIITSTITNVTCATCLDATLTASGSGGTAPYSYTWTPGNFYSQIITEQAAGCYTVAVKDAKGCTSEKVLCAVYDVGIRTINGTSTINVQPNPSEGIFVMTGLQEQSQVLIYDAQGRLIRNLQAKDGTATVNITEYADGTYYARVISNHTTYVIQLMKH